MKRSKCFILVLIFVILSVILSSCKKSDSQLYEEKEKTAEALMLQHRYAEAAEEMEELAGFQKADLFAGYCRGLEAGEKGEFDTAAGLFRKLGEYRDSSKMCVYYTARAHETKAEEGGPDQAEQYLTAAKTYKEVESFRDSKERSEKCYQAVYTIAQEFAEQKQYEQAEKVYIQLEKYLDSASLAQKAKADALYEAGDLAAADEIYNKLDKQYQTYANDYQEKYEKASELKTQKQYDEARELFLILGEYKDSPKQIQDCFYLEATDLLDEKKYDEAATLFSELDYKDSSALALECSYRKAMDLAADRKYDDAAQILTSLNYYKDSKEQLERLKADELFDNGDLAGAWLIYNELDKSCRTHQKEYDEYFETAEKLREEGSYDDARKIYSILGTYGGADELATQCLLDKAEQYEKENYYTEALAVYESIQDQDRIDACHYQYGIYLQNNNRYKAAALQFSQCPDYMDSSEQFYQTGILAYQSGDLKEALDILREDNTHEESAKIIYEIAAAASQRQEYELAISAYDCINNYRDARQERIRNYMLWADQLFEQGEYDQYIQTISALGDSDNTRGMIQKAQYAKAKKLMESGAYEKAKAELQKLDGYEDCASLLKDCEYELASKMYVQGEYQEALASFEREQMTGYRDADTMITDCRYQIGRINEASTDYQGAAELYEMCGDYLDSRERWLECCYRQAVMFKNKEDYSEAVQWFVKARRHINTIGQVEEIIALCDRGGNNQEAEYTRQMSFWIRAENALDNQVYGDAVSYYNRITDPSVTKDREKEALFCYGEELLDAGEYGKAAEMFADAADYPGASEKYIFSRLEEGNQALAAGDYERARACFKEAGNEDKMIEAWKSEAEKHLTAGNYEQARACFKEAGNEDKIVEAWNTEAEKYLTAGNYEQARACFKEAGNEDKIVEVWNTEAEKYLTAGNYEQARACFKEAGNEEKIVSAWISEAEDKLSSGQYEEARQIYITVGMNEKIPAIWELEGEANLAAGNFVEAKDAFRTAGNQSKYEDTVLEEAKAFITAEDYGSAYELLTEIQERDDVQEILRKEQAFISYRINPGDVIVLGTYEQDNNEEDGSEPIEWIVLAADDAYHALVISKFGLDCRPYNLKNAHVTWQTCTLRAWLNHDFYEIAFDKDEQAAILTKEVDNSLRQGNSAWGISGGENTSDNVFLLSYQEVETYLTETQNRMCIPTDYAIARNVYTKNAGNQEPQLYCWWWLRSPGSSSTRAARIGTNGSRAEDDVKQGNVCVRPVLWVDLRAISF